jgi:hypothetical protein
MPSPKVVAEVVPVAKTHNKKKSSVAKESTNDAKVKKEVSSPKKEQMVKAPATVKVAAAPKTPTSPKAKKSTAVEETTINEDIVANAKKATTKTKTKKAASVEEVVSEEVVDKKTVEKTVKKLNVNPTLADTQGLNLSVAKVRNILSDLCINKQSYQALSVIRNTFLVLETEEEKLTIKEAKAVAKAAGLPEPKVKSKVEVKEDCNIGQLSEDIVNYLDICQIAYVESKGLLYSRKAVNKLSTGEKVKYNAAKLNAVKVFEEELLSQYLFQNKVFDLTAFNLNYNNKFYDDMEDYKPNWKESKGKELYDYCINLVNKHKIRFNTESRIFITAFVEFIIKQLVVNGTENCVFQKKKIIQLSHAVNNPSDKFTMFAFISNSNAYKQSLKLSEDDVAENKAISDAEEADDETEDEPEEENENDDDETEDVNSTEVLKKLQFKYYVTELCRNVRMELSNVDEVEASLSKYNQTSVSKGFKQFCSDVITELLQMFGNVLLNEVISREIRTVNYSVIDSLIKNSHTMHNLDYTETIKFIQEKYNIYNVFLAERKEERANKAIFTKASKASE